MADPSNASQLAQYGAVGIFCLILMGVVVVLWNKLNTANDQRIKDAQTYADLVSKKDAEKSAEKDARINDAVMYAKIHNDGTKQAYEFRHSFEEMSNQFVDLQNLIQKRIEVADDKERDARERRERDLQAENEKLKTTARIPAYSLPRKKVPSSHDDE